VTFMEHFKGAARYKSLETPVLESCVCLNVGFITGIAWCLCRTSLRTEISADVKSSVSKTGSRTLHGN
jgi:hypothetical protein